MLHFPVFFAEINFSLFSSRQGRFLRTNGQTEKSERPTSEKLPPQELDLGRGSLKKTSESQYADEAKDFDGVST